MATVPAEVVPPRPDLDALAWLTRAMAMVARWHAVTRGGTEHLQFARRSVIGRVMDEGCQGASHAHGSRPATYLPEDVVVVDKLIAELPKTMREAVVLDQTRSMTIKEICARLRCRPAEFHRAKDFAYGWLAAKIAASGLAQAR